MKTVKTGFKVAGGPYIRAGSRIGAVRGNKLVRYLTIVPVDKHGNHTKPVTVRFHSEDGCEPYYVAPMGKNGVRILSVSEVM